MNSALYGAKRKWSLIKRLE